MNKNKKFILWFKELGIGDIPLVGGKNAALGEMFSNLVPMGINVPDGFALTAEAYRYFLEATGLKKGIKDALAGLNTHNISDLQKKGKIVRNLILGVKLPDDLKVEIKEAYKKICDLYGKDLSVAVRSSATAEDLPDASFAGAQETYLNVSGIEDVFTAVKKCISSLFTDRAISYREDKGFSHFDVALSVGVQRMVRSDLACSGVAFTIDTESGFDKIVVINGSYGLGEMIVKGRVTPDEFIVFKPNLENSADAVIARDLGKKNIKLIYSGNGTKLSSVSKKDQDNFCLTNEEILHLAKECVVIEKHFSKKRGKYQPMDIEWAKDGKTNEIFIVQARPETVHSSTDKNIYKEYRLTGKGKVLASGSAVGTKVASGIVRIIRNPKEINLFKKGEILITEMTDPDWEPIMKIASAIVTDKGGRTSHAAIVSRELGIPCIVGCGNATRALKSGYMATVDCSSGEVGKIYDGKIPFEIIEHHLDKLPKTKVKVMVNIGSPDDAFKNHYLPVDGVGLGRLEFIIVSHIKIHPNALINYSKLKVKAGHDKKVAKVLKQIDALTTGYKNKAEYYVDELSEGIAKIAAAFWPNEVIIRFSDFKTNEYRTLIGGEFYEPIEENPMLGWRGASRYYDPKFKEAFALECLAMKRVRQKMGLKNVVPMIPFCRTPEEGKKVIEVMEKNELSKKKDKDLRVYVMCEIPSNVILADEFLDVFDGMSIGSNDLTQLVLGLDRDSGIVTHIANENNDAVKDLIAKIIVKCRERKKYIGICGQAPSDYPEFADFLIEKGITSISLNPDTVIKTMARIAAKEKRIK